MGVNTCPEKHLLLKNNNFNITSTTLHCTSFMFNQQTYNFTSDQTAKYRVTLQTGHVRSSCVEQSRQQNNIKKHLPIVDLVLSSSAKIRLSCSIFAMIRSISLELWTPPVDTPVDVPRGDPVLPFCTCDCAWLPLCAYFSVPVPMLLAAMVGSTVQVFGNNGREFGGWFGAAVVLGREDEENGPPRIEELIADGLVVELFTP